MQDVTKSVKELKDAIYPLLLKGATATNEHLVEIEGQVYLLNQGIAALSGGPGLDTVVPAEAPSMPTGTAGVPAGTPNVNPGGPSMPAYPFGGPTPPPAESPGMFGAAAPMTPGPMGTSPGPMASGPVTSPKMPAAAAMGPPGNPPPVAPCIKMIFFQDASGNEVRMALGGNVPAMKPTCYNLPEPATKRVRSVSPTGYTQTVAQGLNGTFAPKGWAIVHSRHCHRMYD